MALTTDPAQGAEADIDQEPDRSWPQLEGYVILRQLGQGGMGKVFLAHEQLLDRNVALKFLQQGGSAELARRFLHEARLAAKLNHPNIVTIHHVGQHQGEAFIAMEYIEGGSLADELQRSGKMPWREATEAVSGAALALKAAHTAGLIHRDIKPSNLMRASSGQIKVVDFGLAKPSESAEADITVTRPGTVMGSPAYMSPEQCRGQPADRRSDLYSLICTYYQLITGRAPFGGQTVEAVLYQHCHEPFPDASQFVADLPPGVKRILAKGGRKEIDQRYQSADELLADLEGILHGAPRRSTAESRMSSKKRPLILAGCGATVLAAGAFLAWGLGGHSRATPASMTPPVPANSNASPGAPDATAPNKPAHPLASLDSAQPGLVRTLTGHQGSIFKLQFLADGNLVSDSQDHTVRVWDVVQGKQVQQFDAVYSTPQWTNSGILAASGSLWRLADGSQIRKIPGPVNSCLAASPDGTLFVFRNNDDGSMNLFDVARGTRDHLFPPAKDATGKFSSDGKYFVYAGAENVQVYAVDGWKRLATFKGADHQYAQVSVDCSPDGKLVLVKNNEWHHGTALLWDWRTGHETLLFQNRSHAERSFWSPDGSIVGINDWGAKPFFDTATGLLQFNGQDINGGADDYLFTSDSRRIIAPGAKQLAIQEVGNDDSRRILPGDGVDATLRAMALSSDDRLLATAVEYGKSLGPIRIYRLPDFPAPAASK